MKIDTTREGGAADLRLEGRLDREWAEHLSNTLEDLLRDGVRSLRLDLSAVSYMSSAATTVLARWRQELAVLRGEVKLTSLSPAVRDTLAIAGWDSPLDSTGAPSGNLRLSSWSLRADLASSGQYQTSSSVPEGVLRLRLHGHPERLSRDPVGPGDCEVVVLPRDAFGLGLGAIGGTYDACRERFGELVAVAGCMAHFPSDGARKADYLVGDGPVPPRATLASGLICEGGFSKLVRFNTQADAESVPFSELARVALEAVGGKTAGLVVAAETIGLAGARLKRSPAARGAAPMSLQVPAVREWISFAPERTHAMGTALIAGVVAKAPEPALRAHLRPLAAMGQLYGHFHVAVFPYHAVPQRTVDLGTLVRGFFSNHELRDVLHLLWDDRVEGGVGESALVRGVAWVSPIVEIA
jgi:anti-anti-sigma factor